MAENKVTKIGRDKVATFMNVSPNSASAENFALVGLGVTTGQIAMNAEITTEQYIHQVTAFNSVDSYAPSFSVTQTAFKGNPVYDYVFDLYINRATQSKAETQIINVYLAEETGEGTKTFLAEKQDVTIEITSYGGDAGSPVAIEYVIHFNGDHKKGTATITEGVPSFTEELSA